MGNVLENIPIVNVVNDIFSSNSSSASPPETIKMKPINQEPIIFRPKNGTYEYIPPPPKPGILDQIKNIDQDTLIYIAGGTIILIILLKQ